MQRGIDNDDIVDDNVDDNDDHQILTGEDWNEVMYNGIAVGGMAYR